MFPIQVESILYFMIFVQILFSLYVAFDTNARGMNSVVWTLFVLFTGLIGILVYFMVRKPKPTLSTKDSNPPIKNEYIAVDQPILNIPDTCPYCKSPNTRKIRLCEWCGAQIC